MIENKESSEKQTYDVRVFFGDDVIYEGQTEAISIEKAIANIKYRLAKDEIPLPVGGFDNLDFKVEEHKAPIHKIVLEKRTDDGAPSQPELPGTEDETLAIRL